MPTLFEFSNYFLCFLSFHGNIPQLTHLEKINSSFLISVLKTLDLVKMRWNLETSIFSKSPKCLRWEGRDLHLEKTILIWWYLQKLPFQIELLSTVPGWHKSSGDIISSSIKLAIFIFRPPSFSIVLGTMFVIKYFQTIYIGKDTRNSHKMCTNNEANRLAGGAPTRGPGFLTWAARWNHCRFLLLLPDISFF